MASNKKLDKDGLSKVWQKVFELIKSITGDVDVVNKGTLQDQINNKINKGSCNILEFDVNDDGILTVTYEDGEGSEG